MARVILHIDMNAYFASCALIVHPEYKGKPLAIAENNSRSIISTASYEARKYGVNSAMPVYMAKKLCPNLILVSPNFKLYEYYTQRFVSIIKTFSPIIQMASIDECYVDMTEQLKGVKEPLDVIKEIQKQIYAIGLPCSIGVSTNKFLAKMASDMKKPLGITVIRKREVKAKLWPLPIRDMFGIGKKTAPRLEEAGIKTIGDLATCTDEYLLRRVLGRGRLTLQAWANGIDDSPVSTEVDDLKSIGHSRTLERSTNNYQEISEMLSYIATLVSQRAKKEHLIGNTIAITIKYADFTVKQKSAKLEDYTNDKDIILSNALALFDKLYTNQELRLVGITLQKTIRDDDYTHQMSIYDMEQKTLPKSSASEIQSIIKRINQELGQEVLFVMGRKKL